MDLAGNQDTDRQQQQQYGRQQGANSKQMSVIPEDEFAADGDDAWTYSMPASLESLPLEARPSQEGDQESVISELEDVARREADAAKPAKRAVLKVDTGITGPVRSEPIDIRITSRIAGAGEGIIRSPPKLAAAPGISTSSLAQMMKSTPAGPLTTVEEVHNKSSPSTGSTLDASICSDEKVPDDRSSLSTSRQSEALYQLKQSLSAGSLSSCEKSDDATHGADESQSTEADAVEKAVSGDATAVAIKPSTSDSNGSFFSTFRTVAQSMLASPSGSHLRTPSDVSVGTAPATPLQHRRTVSGTTVDEEGELKLGDLAEHHQPEIISYRRGKRPKSSSVSSVNGSAKSPGGAVADAASSSSPTTPLSAAFDRNLYIDEFYKDTGYRYATLKRNADFHSLFPSVPVDNRLLDDFSCALSREILIQGRIYVSENFFAFNSNILGWVTNLVIPCKDVVNIEKKATAGLFNNGIAIETKDAKHYFATFISRDATFKFMNTVWEQVEKSPSETSSIFKSRKWKMKYKTDGIGLIDFGDDVDSSSDRDRSEDGIDLQNMALSIDGDTPKLADGAEGFDDLDHGVQIRPESGYRLEGPAVHTPTDVDHDVKRHKETLLFVETVAAPPGLVFNVLFGENTEFHRHLMELSDGSNFSSYSRFVEDAEGCVKREFSYQKALGYSIGPKSTKVNVSEVVEQKDFDARINVLTTSATPDVPSGNAFTVNTRYVLAWGPGNTTTFQLSYFVRWTGSSWIKGLIETQTATGQRDVADLLLKELRAKLEEIVVRGSVSPILLDGAQRALPALPEKDTHPAVSLKDRIGEELDEVESAIESFGQEIRASVPRWLGLLIVVVLALQLYQIGLLRESNALMRQQMEMVDVVFRGRSAVFGAGPMGGDAAQAMGAE